MRTPSRNRTARERLGRFGTWCAAIAVLLGAALIDSHEIPTRSAYVSEAEARANLQRAESQHGPISPEAAEALHVLAIALENEAAPNLDEARAVAESALLLREQLRGANDAGLAEALEHVAFIAWKQEDAGRARPCLERALEIREQDTPVDTASVARDLHYLSDVRWVEGDVGGALLSRERVGPMVEHLYGPESELMAVHLSRLEQLQEATGDYGRAFENAKRAVAIRERLLSSTNPRLAASLNDLGSLFLRVGDIDAAEREFRRALAISQAQPVPDPAAEARALEHVGEALVARGDAALALPQFERALALRSKAFEADHVLVARSLSRLGAAERTLGRVAEARRHLQQAVGIQEHAPAISRPELATSLHELALLEWHEGDAATALDAALRAESITRENFQFTVGGLSQREALSQARARERGLDLAITCALALDARGELSPRNVSRVFDELVRSRALVLEVVASRQRLVAVHPDPRTSELVDALRFARNRLTRLTQDALATGTRVPDDTVRNAEQAADTAERLLAERSLAFREELTRQRTGAKEVLSALPPSSALVSYVGYRAQPDGFQGGPEERYAVFVLRSDEDAPRLIGLGAAPEIEAAVGAWQSSVSRDPRLQRETDPVAAYRRNARRLGELIWSPLVSSVQGLDKLMVTRDGALQRVSLATLLTPDGDYLVASGPTISYAGAERDLVAVSQGVNSELGLLAIGDPAFSEPASPADPKAGAAAFDPLPGALDEVTEIASRWPSKERTVVLTGADANEMTVMRLAPNCRVLHFATHTFDEGGPERDADGTDPLRLTGLAMAGANRRTRSADPGTDDGVLTAAEIALLDLHGVEWAVLSSCASGRGAIEAREGTLGLERAFRIAGAHTVIDSLWPVEDDATRSWMRELYAARRGGASTAEAVRHAARVLLDRQRREGRSTHPYAWGSFVAVGDGR